MKRIPLIFVIFSFFFLVCSSDVQALTSWVGSCDDTYLLNDEDRIYIEASISPFLVNSDLNKYLVCKYNRGLSGYENVDKYRFLVCVTDDNNIVLNDYGSIDSISCVKKFSLSCSAYSGDTCQYTGVTIDTDDYQIATRQFKVYSFTSSSSSVLSIEEFAPYLVLVGMCSLLIFLAIMWKRK